MFPASFQVLILYHLVFSAIFICLNHFYYHLTLSKYLNNFQLFPLYLNLLLNL